MDIRNHNRDAWNNYVKRGNQWTKAVSPDEIARAKKGDWGIVLTPTKSVPASWFPDFQGQEVLCLASGGGQQAPILAAAGGLVTTLDNSPLQLEQDRIVAERENLPIQTVEGDMRDLSMFKNEQFVLIFHPVSNIFVPDIIPVWQEAFRVLKPGGVLLSGICNPLMYVFDWEKIDHEGLFEMRYSLPYSDMLHLPKDQLQERINNHEALEFSHTLEEQIGGQIDAGFLIAGFYEDIAPDELISKYLPTFFATKAMKP
jgi:SAM-dependent methyltransferase